MICGITIIISPLTISLFVFILHNLSSTIYIHKYIIRILTYLSNRRPPINTLLFSHTIMSLFIIHIFHHLTDSLQFIDQNRNVRSCYIDFVGRFHGHALDNLIGNVNRHQCTINGVLLYCIRNSV